MLVTPLAFLVGIAILVAVHEYGHFRMARACGVKVLQFSIGFGPVMREWVSPTSGTAYRIGWLPLGGFVRMLDEREAPVTPEWRHAAFNRQPLAKRAAIVAAGPLANFALAWALFAVLTWSQDVAIQPKLATPYPGSLLARAGVLGGDVVLSAKTVTPGEMSDATAGAAVAAFEDVLSEIATAQAQGKDLVIEVRGERGGVRSITLATSTLPEPDDKQVFWRQVGLTSPWVPAQVTGTVPQSGAHTAGLQVNDLIVALNDRPVSDAAHAKHLLQSMGHADGVTVSVRRGTETMTVKVMPSRVSGEWRMGVMFGIPPTQVSVEVGAFDALYQGGAKLFNSVDLTLTMMVKMLTGEASLKNLSGPLTIADYAGQTAQAGWTSYLGFLAVVSVGLGVMNLLPLPVLDGGHLMYYLLEFVRGKPLTEVTMQRMQKVGMFALMLLMVTAVTNDLLRLFAT